MASILSFVQIHAPFLVAHKYIFLLIASSLEGFNTMVIAGFLVSIGTFSLWAAAGICLIGEITNSYFWYYLGYWAGAKPIDWLLRNSPQNRQTVERIREYLDEYTGRILLLMKVTFSLTIVTLILTGGIRYNIKKFSLYNFIGSVGWIAITFTIGYFFGQGYKLYVSYFQQVGYLIIFIIGAFLLIAMAERIGGKLFTEGISWTTYFRRLSYKAGKGIEKLMTPEDSEDQE